MYTLTSKMRQVVACVHLKEAEARISKETQILAQRTPITAAALEDSHPELAQEEASRRYQPARDAK